jgi:dolichol-phosphate mannosyltransferase
MELSETLKKLELARIDYWKNVDYFLNFRLKWRAQMVRHLFHVLPGETILELGCASGEWSNEILQLTKGHNPICAATFNAESFTVMKNKWNDEPIEPILLDDFPGKLKGRRFNFIIGWQLLTNDENNPLLVEIKKLLEPGGQILFFEPNPWNIYFNLRMLLLKFMPFLKRRNDLYFRPRNRIDLFTIISEIGYVSIKILPYDFLFPPIPRKLLWTMQNLSLILENTPYLRNFAGSLYIWAQNPPPENWKRPLINLAKHDSLKGKLSVIVPCHNEEMNIPPLIEHLRGYYDEYIYEILIVDDNSIDNTADITKQLSVTYPKVRLIRRSMPNGVGRALRDGLDAANGEYMLMLDCDFQHLLPEITDLFDAIVDGADVAIGSRFSRNSVLLNYDFTKILANRGFHILANILLRKKFRDISNNLKLMKREVAKNLRLQSNDFAANAETGLVPILLGYNVKEIPISWINRSVTMGFSSFKLMKTAPNYFFILWKLFFGKFKRENVDHKANQHCIKP